MTPSGNRPNLQYLIKTSFELEGVEMDSLIEQQEASRERAHTVSCFISRLSNHTSITQKPPYLVDASN